MRRRLGSQRRPVAQLAGIGILAVGLASCNLDVNDPDIVTPEDVSDPASLPVAVAGMVGDFQEYIDNHVLYTGLFTDEFLLAGTFPTRNEYDKLGPINVSNTSLNQDLWEIVNVSRFSADNLVAGLMLGIGDPEFDQDVTLEGIALGQYYGAYVRILLAEFYCQSIFGGGDETAVNYEPTPKLPDERMQEAISLFQAAEATAVAAGRSDVSEAARVGQARANMWLGNYSQAATIAATVDSDFGFVAEYSTNVPLQYNGVYQSTYGDQANIRWTIGNGTQPQRDLEKFAFYDEWVALDLIDPEPDPVIFQAFDGQISLHLQKRYGDGSRGTLGQSAPIPIATGFEMRMVEAEAAYRSGDVAGAEAMINALITDPANNPLGRAFNPVDLTGDFSADITEIGRAYEAGLWLTGHRLHFVRRVLRNDGLDLFPPERSGADRSSPMAQQEVDNNKDISAACSSGPPWS